MKSMAAPNIDFSSNRAIAIMRGQHAGAALEIFVFCKTYSMATIQYVGNHFAGDNLTFEGAILWRGGEGLARHGCGARSICRPGPAP